MSDTIAAFLDELNKKLAQKDKIVLAVEGECASLKTTLAQALQEKLGAGVIHCDDFFLPSELRTPERFTEPGGNIDYVRMKEEVIDKLRASEIIKYRPFDCHSMEFANVISIPNAKLMIVEGAYAMHPYFDRYYDMSLFLCAAKEERIRRIVARGQNAEIFLKRWIPLENRYFEAYELKDRVDYIIDTTEYKAGFADALTV